MNTAGQRSAGRARAAAAERTLRVAQWGQISWIAGDDTTPAEVVERIAVTVAVADAVRHSAEARGQWQHPAVAALNAVDFNESVEHGRVVVCRLHAPRGAALADVRAASGIPSWTELQVAALWRDVLAALRSGHAAGLVAGLVTPEHLIVCPPGAEDQTALQLLHAGLPAVLEAAGVAWPAVESTAFAALCSTPACVAPEVLAGHPPHAASDAYAAAACMIWTALGRHAYDAADTATLRNLAAQGPSAVLSSLVHGQLPQLAAPLLRALQPQPWARSGVLDDLHAACTALANGQPQAERDGTQVLLPWARGSALIPLAASIPAAQWHARWQPQSEVLAAALPTPQRPQAAGDRARLRAALDQLDHERLRQVSEKAARQRRQQWGYWLALLALLAAASLVVLARQQQLHRDLDAAGSPAAGQSTPRRPVPPRPQPRLLNPESPATP